MRSAHAEEPENSPISPGNGLSVKQTEYLQAYSAAPYLSTSAICREIDIKPQQVSNWKRNSEKFRQALAVEHRRSQQVANMNRKTVLRGMMEAIDLAKDLRQPAAIISGWKEVARMCGYYEPERREILLSVDKKQLLEEIQSLPKAKLLELMHEHETPIEAEFEVVDAPT